MTFDLSLLDTRAASDAGVWLTLQDIHGNDVIDDEGKAVQFHLCGRDTAVVKEAFKSLAGKEGEALDEASTQVLAKCVKGWSQNIGIDGKTLDFSAENAVKLLRIPHIGDWVLREVMNRANFTTKK